MIESEVATILVDSGPDLRIQALRHGLNKVDHVLYTHAHLDHISGFDELRAFCWRREEALPLYGNEGCISELKRIFYWAFENENIYQGYVRPDPHVLTNTVNIGNLNITPIPVIHGSVETSGYLFQSETGGSVAYISDVKEIPQSSIDLIKNVDTLIIGCLREQGHYSHMSIAECLSAINRIAPEKAYLTHVSHEMDCNEVARALPKNVQFAYDTQTFTF
ncbi:MBL fold metallo-hydrolase [Akkermansiaceae bacterium]|nr:MBL fold metallo-hydrolase [Akkermansiaceae bacterium]